MSYLAGFFAVAALAALAVWAILAWRGPAAARAPAAPAAPATPPLSLPEGLRLATRAFTLVVNQDAETITLRAPEAVHRTVTNPAGGDRRMVDLTLPAAGLRVELSPDWRPLHPHNRRRAERAPDIYTRSHLRQGGVPAAPSVPMEPTGTCTVTFVSRRHPLAEQAAAAAEADSVRVPHVDLAEAEQFMRHFKDVAAWITEVETALRARVEQHGRERRQAQQRAEAQLAQRAAQCEFPVLHRAIDVDARGEVLWAILLDGSGRCWVEAQGKTFIGSLAGARATPQLDSLELMVRDSKWETSYFSRRKMKLFIGSDEATLQQWAQRINDLAAGAGKSVAVVGP